MSQVGILERTVSDVSTLVHENYVNDIKPWVDFLDPVAALFQQVGSGGYTLVGEKLQFAAEQSYAGGWMGTDGYLPDHEQVNPAELYWTPKRLYLRRAVDNFLEAVAQRPGAYEDLAARIQRQQLDAIQRGTARHIHGSTNATVCTFVSRTSATVIVVDAGFGHAGTSPTMFLEPGMTLALLDNSISYNLIGVATLTTVAHNTSTNTATLTFATDIDTSSTAADGDVLVFATTNSTSNTNYGHERNKAPTGLLDILDPDAASTTLGGASESTYPRWAPINRASVDWGHVELMEFAAEIMARSQAPVTAASHVLTMHPGAKIELAKTLLSYQQQAQLGRELQGGWTTVRVGEFDAIESPYHLHDVAYLLCPEDLAVVDLDGEPSVWTGDGGQFSRLADYDGKEWFVRHYVERFPTRRNRMGALTSVYNPNKERYSAIPVSA